MDQHPEHGSSGGHGMEHLCSHWGESAGVEPSDEPSGQRSQQDGSKGPFGRGGKWTDVPEYNHVIEQQFAMWQSLGAGLGFARGGNGNPMAEHHVVDEKPDLHGPVKVARGQGFIRALPEEVLNMLIAVERRPDWDDLCDYASRVKWLGESSDIVYLSYQGKLGVCARDLCLLRAWQTRPDGSTVLVSNSVECDDVPRVAGKVRAECHECAYMVSPVEDGCIFSYVIQLDMKGYVPLFFSNLIQTQHPLIISMLRRYLEGGSSHQQ